MEIPFIILFGVFSLLILYIIIETAVRKGIDGSETAQLIRRVLEEQKDESPSRESIEGIDKD
jgi:hypothetical protein